MEDLKDVAEFLLPGSDCILIALRVKLPGGHVPLVLFDDLPLDVDHGSAAEALVGFLSSVRVPSSTHAPSRPITPITVLLGSSDSAPLNPDQVFRIPQRR